MTHGTIAGLLIRDLIIDNHHEWEEIYSPSRKPVSGMAGLNFLTENANVMKRYALDWLPGSDSPQVDQLELDQGTVVNEE